METKSNRRQFLKIGAITGATFLLRKTVPNAIAAACGLPTPPQTPGPFYPGEGNFHPDSDLTQVPGLSTRAKGQVIYIRGRILNAECNPIPGANVEIWQACASGRYNNPKDPNPAPIDPNFRYWGEVITGVDGSYLFKTIIPGAYPADANWMRPPHIHFRISCLGYHELVTQMYFKGNQWNDRDLILRDVPENQRESVIVDFQPSGGSFEPGSLIGNFDINLMRAGHTRF